MSTEHRYDPGHSELSESIREFIVARLAADEAAANAACGAPWEGYIGSWVHVSAKARHDDKLRFGHLGYVGTIERDADREHVVGNDPAAALRRSRVFRAMLEHADSISDQNSVWVLGDMFERMYRDIAAYWSGHADYRPEWAPETSERR